MSNKTTEQELLNSLYDLQDKIEILLNEERNSRYFNWSLLDFHASLNLTIKRLENSICNCQDLM
jgi:hypothetical protein